MTDFLLELRSEEIPARMQDKARADLARLFGDERERQQLEVALREHTPDAEPVSSAASAATEAGSFTGMTAKTSGSPKAAEMPAVMS